jgi:hypothetical protein
MQFVLFLRYRKANYIDANNIITSVFLVIVDVDNSNANLIFIIFYNYNSGRDTLI